MLRYIFGLLKNLLNPAVSIFARVDSKSRISNLSKVNSFCQVYSSSIGKYSYLGRHSSLICAEVGNFCSIGDNVMVGLGNHTIDYLSTSPIFTEKHNGTGSTWIDSDISYPYKKVNVGNDVWIGERVMILGGVKVGDGAVIGAGAIVTKDVPAYSIVAGVPARVLRYRFSSEIISELENLKWWNYSDKELKRLIPSFQKECITIDDIRKMFNI